MKYSIITYGCQMNHSDSERIAAILRSVGFSDASKKEKIDLLIINSCSVRQSAINRIYGQLINFKKTNKSGKTILTGCILESDKKKLKDKFDLIIDIKELTDRKNDKLKKMLKLLNPDANEQEFKAFDYTDYFKINPQYRSNFSAYIPIMTGCNNFCAYCAVPFTRGREISRPAEEIIAEIKRLIGKGYKEITLLGQNVNSYNSKITNNKLQITNKSQNPNLKSQTNTKTIKFPELLKQISDIPGDFWIRFLTSHPKDMSTELIETMAKCAKICEYVHLPIQAGNDKILEIMNRRYTSAHYLKLIGKIKSAFEKQKKDLAISTDIIVGFPGETKTQFADTARVMRSVKYDMAYLAQYSPRPGTAAAKLKDNISITEKKRRKEFLNDILRKTALANNKKYEGKIVEVLIEKIEIENGSPQENRSRNLIATGKTRTFKNVRITLPRTPLGSIQGESLESKISIGQFTKIKIIKTGAWGLEGKIAE